MSHSGKILSFPSRTGGSWLSPKDADLAAAEVLALYPENWSEANRQKSFSSPDILLAICAQLRRKCDMDPTMVEGAAREIYQWISQPTCDLGLFDERDYFLGETALLAGGACRQLGRREEGFLWFDRAEAGFRHTMNPAPGLANVAYARLALRFEMGRYQDVRELAPSLEASFRKLRMELEAVKCRLLLGMTLKQVGENSAAIAELQQVRSQPAVEADPFLHARLLTEIGDLEQLEGNPSSALELFHEALALLQGEEVSLARADLKLYVGGLYKSLERLGAAREAYRAAQRDYATLGMRHLVAYSHLVIAEVLLEMEREREAEWEILAALPAIDEIKMVPEGLAAVALLRESVARRKTNLLALHDLRTRLESAG